MAIQESSFLNEAELENWVKSNFTSFQPATVLLNGFRITTPSGKHGIPDGFPFDLKSKSWSIIECELLSHGVWPHIAEQITRFTVAAQSTDTLRIARDKLFEEILNSGISNTCCRELGIEPERLHQHLELFIQGIKPQLLIFIDDTNRDLEDFVNALDIPTSIYRVKKLLVDGNTDYYSPDQKAPAIEAEPDDASRSSLSEFEVLELLGGGSLKDSIRRFKCYELADSSVVNIKRSKLHEEGNYYWYGISASGIKHMNDLGVTHVVFIMDNFGFVKVPRHLLDEYLSVTKASHNEDGSLRHYHVLISNESDPEMYWSNEVDRFPLAEHFHAFD